MSENARGAGVPEYVIERTATIMWLLGRGGKYTTRELMQVTGLTRQGVWYHMSCISHASVPVAQIDGRWQFVNEEDADDFSQENLTQLMGASNRT